MKTMMSLDTQEMPVIASRDLWCLWLRPIAVWSLYPSDLGCPRGICSGTNWLSTSTLVIFIQHHYCLVSLTSLCVTPLDCQLYWLTLCSAWALVVGHFWCPCWWMWFWWWMWCWWWWWWRWRWECVLGGLTYYLAPPLSIRRAPTTQPHY